MALQDKDYFDTGGMIGASEEEKTGKPGLYILWSFSVPINLITFAVYAVSTFPTVREEQVKEMFRQLAGELGTTEELVFMTHTFKSVELPDSAPIPLSRRQVSYTVLGPIGWDPQYLKGALETGKNTMLIPQKGDILWRFWLPLDERTEVMYAVTLPPNSTEDDAKTLFHQLAVELGTTEELERLNEVEFRNSPIYGRIKGSLDHKHVPCSRRILTRVTNGYQETSDIQYLKSEVG